MFLNCLELLGFNCLLLAYFSVITIQNTPYTFALRRILIQKNELEIWQRQALKFTNAKRVCIGTRQVVF